MYKKVWKNRNAKEQFIFGKIVHLHQFRGCGKEDLCD